MNFNRANNANSDDMFMSFGGRGDVDRIGQSLFALSGKDYHHSSTQFTPSDVLCGKTKESFNHDGNRQFREIVRGSINDYNKADTRLKKSIVVHKIVEVIKSNGGRFLKQRSDMSWYELDSRQVREKVGHAIRDAVRDAASMAQNKKQKKGEPEKAISGKRRRLSGDSSSSEEGNQLSDNENTSTTQGANNKEESNTQPNTQQRDGSVEFLNFIESFLGPLPADGSEDPLQQLLR